MIKKKRLAPDVASIKAKATVKSNRTLSELISVIGEERYKELYNEVRKTLLPSGVVKLLKTEKQGIKLSVGCGFTLQEGFVGIDVRDVKNNCYIKHDLETYPWPLPDECAHIVVAGLVVEHINPARMGIVKFMDEIWRVTKTGSQLMISTPMAGSPMADTDPGHTRSFTESSFYYFDPLHQSGLWNIYRPKPWKIKGVMFNASGLIEVVMEKRIVDVSYETAKPDTSNVMPNGRT